jgi:hypothetical protein
MFQVTHVPDRVSFEHCSSLLAVARADAVLLLMLQLSLLFTGCVTMSAAPEGRRAFASKAAVALVGKSSESQYEQPMMRSCNPHKLHFKLRK